MAIMTINLTQKERLLLEDQKKHEELCIQKYTNYANQAQDPQLKQLFNTHAQHERQHLNTVNQILAGQVPNMQSQNQQGQQQNQQGQAGYQGMQTYQQQMYHQPTYHQSNMSNYGQSAVRQTNANDAYLCNDLLATEKHVSSTYDTAIFEMTDTNVRKALNHIQKEEQQHGEDLFNYLQSKGMY